MKIKYDVKSISYFTVYNILASCRCYDNIILTRVRPLDQNPSPQNRQGRNDEIIIKNIKYHCIDVKCTSFDWDFFLHFLSATMMRTSDISIVGTLIITTFIIKLCKQIFF